MSLSAWEQQALESIKNNLACSDPQLAEFLATFTRLTAGEEMPARERVRPASRRTARYPRRRSARRLQRLGLQQAAMLLWALIAVTLIAVALALSRSDGQRSCTHMGGVVCASPAPVRSLGLVADSPRAR